MRQSLLSWWFEFKYFQNVSLERQQETCTTITFGLLHKEY